MDRDQLYRLYITEEHGLLEISQVTGKAVSTVRYWILKHGIRLRTIREAANLVRWKHSLWGKGRPRGPMSEEQKKKISQTKLQRWEESGKAKNIRLKTKGYLEHTRGEHKGRHVHDVIMETHIGRRLRKGEHVHHIDENKLNNALENLKLMTISEHMSEHAKKNYNNRKRNTNGRFI